jgi:hypothetical protein
MPGPAFGVVWSFETNCYAYAVHSNTGFRLMPGEISRALFTEYTPVALDRLYQADGLIPATAAEIAAITIPGILPVQPVKPHHYLVAAKCNDIDFHLLRRDELTGEWYGKSPNVGLVIHMGYDNFIPQTSRWSAVDFHVNWVGYYWVPDAGIPVPARTAPGDQGHTCSCLCAIQ